MSELAVLTMVTEAVAIVCMITWFVRESGTRDGKKPAVPEPEPEDEDDEVTEKAVGALPCPFCGGFEMQVIVAEGKDGYSHIRCERCEADGPVVRDAEGRASISEMRHRASEGWEMRRHA